MSTDAGYTYATAWDYTAGAIVTTDTTINPKGVFTKNGLSGENGALGASLTANNLNVDNDMIYTKVQGNAENGVMTIDGYLTVASTNTDDATKSCSPQGGGIVISQLSTGKIITIAGASSNTAAGELMCSVKSTEYGKYNDGYNGRIILKSDNCTYNAPTGVNVIPFTKDNAPAKYYVRAEVDGYAIKIWYGLSAETIDLSKPTYYIDDIYSKFLKLSNGHNGGYHWTKPTGSGIKGTENFPFYAGDTADGSYKGTGSDIVLGFTSFYNYQANTRSVTVENGNVTYTPDTELASYNVKFGDNEEISVKKGTLVRDVAPALANPTVEGTTYTGTYYNYIPEQEVTADTTIDTATITTAYGIPTTSADAPWVGTGQAWDTTTVGDVGKGTFTMKSTFTCWATGTDSRPQGAGFAIRQLSTGKIIQVSPNFQYDSLILSIAGAEKMNGAGANGWSHRIAVSPTNKASANKSFSARNTFTSLETAVKYDMMMTVDGYTIKVWIGDVGTTFDPAKPNYVINDVYTNFKNELAYSNKDNNWYKGSRGDKLFPFFLDTSDGMYKGTNAMACVGLTTMSDKTGYTLHENTTFSYTPDAE
jgi:hypothetical protein